jgi:poly(hydroxyalkanoate) granule-associated protein
MNQETIVIENGTVETEHVSLTYKITDTAHKALQVGLGAVDMTKDQVLGMANKAQNGTSEFVSKLAERGAKVETTNRERVNEVVESGKKQTDETVHDAQEALDSRIKAALQRMNIPTKDDVDSLNDKLDKLSKKLDELEK